MTNDYFTNAGEFYGYPECCIEMFNARAEEVQKTRHSSLGTQFMHGSQPTGYLMCDECAAKKRPVLIAEINERRDSRIAKFPSTTLVYDFEAVLDGRTKQSHSTVPPNS